MPSTSFSQDLMANRPRCGRAKFARMAFAGLRQSDRRFPGLFASLDG